MCLAWDLKNQIWLLQIHNLKTYFRKIFEKNHVYGPSKRETVGPWTQTLPSLAIHKNTTWIYNTIRIGVKVIQGSMDLDPTNSIPYIWFSIATLYIYIFWTIRLFYIVPLIIHSFLFFSYYPTPNITQVKRAKIKLIQMYTSKFGGWTWWTVESSMYTQGHVPTNNMNKMKLNY